MSIFEISHPSLGSVISCEFKMRLNDEKTVFVVDKPEFVMGNEGKPIRNPLLEAGRIRVVSDDTVSFKKFKDTDGEPVELVGDQINRENLWVLPNGVTNHHYGHIVFTAPSSLYSFYEGRDDIPF
jgi:hypothetical protein